jgi:hypothetical protein
LRIVGENRLLRQHDAQDRVAFTDSQVAVQAGGARLETDGIDAGQRER